MSEASGPGPVHAVGFRARPLSAQSSLSHHRTIESMIHVEQLTKSFGAVQALRDVSFTVADGRITGLLGHNGAGKSTTLRILSTVIRANSGRASVDGHDCASEPLAVRRCLGVLPHASGLYQQLTGRENIAYYGRLHGLNKDELHQATEAMIERLGMSAFVDRRAKGYSQGERLKVALARTLIHRPRTVILDEPTNGLDVNAVRMLREFIRELRASGCCVLFSSHVMQEVAALCDDIIIISQGAVAVRGTPDEILASLGTTDLEEAFVRAAAGEVNA